MLYQYFQPHHNPRLRLIPVRMQEIGELEQAAKELRRAVQRAQLRTEYAPVGDITREAFVPALEYLDQAIISLSSLVELHPGDNDSTLKNLVEERKESPGWESWVELVTQRFSLLDNK